MNATASITPDRPVHRRGGVTVARALGSSTRAGIFEHLREAAAALTVREIAETFDLHPNVARTHLETLADAGLVVVGRRKHPGGGRPAKLYLAREERPAADDDVIPAQGGGSAAALLVRLMATLLDEPNRGSGPALLARAHEAAAAEGRRMVTALGEREVASGIEAAAQGAVRALRPVAPEARVLRSGPDWVEIAGVRGVFRLLTGARPELAEAFERGLTAGALAGTGVPVSLGDGESAGPSGGAVWRARALQTASSRASVEPAAAVDTRGLQREAGVVKAMRAVTTLRRGEVLEVLAEGPGSPAAFARWADRAGHQLLGVERAVDGTGRAAIRLLIRKGS